VGRFLFKTASFEEAELLLLLLLDEKTKGIFGNRRQKGEEGEEQGEGEEEEVEEEELIGLR
jgi:hypothetical protein